LVHLFGDVTNAPLTCEKKLPLNKPLPVKKQQLPVKKQQLPAKKHLPVKKQLPLQRKIREMLMNPENRKKLILMIYLILND
jgi:hypothetical protein